jgi:hypothetical protein
MVATGDTPVISSQISAQRNHATSCHPEPRHPRRHTAAAAAFTSNLTYVSIYTIKEDVNITGINHPLHINLLPYIHPHFTDIPLTCLDLFFNYPCHLFLVSILPLTFPAYSLSRPPALVFNILALYHNYMITTSGISSYSTVNLKIVIMCSNRMSIVTRDNITAFSVCVIICLPVLGSDFFCSPFFAT